MDRKAILMAVLLLLAPLVSIEVVAIRPAKAVETLKVGVIGPYNLPQWHKEQGGMEGGALLAMMDGLGLINVGGTQYQVELVFADEHAYPLDEAKAYAEAYSLCEQGCKFIIGGFRTEVTWRIIEAIRDYNEATGDTVIYLINGASTDQLISETVGVDYNRYKWLFRINPINSTMLGKTVFGYLAGYFIPKRLIPMYGTPIKVGCLTEDLAWTAGICYFVMNILPTLFPPGVVESVYCGRSPAGTSNFIPYLDAAKNAGVHVLVIAYTLPDAIQLLKQWKEGQYKFILLGIDVFAQQGTYPIQTGGACEYIIIEDFSGTRTPITPLAVPFWDHFVGNFSCWPLYTAWGAYNAFIVLKKALETAGTLDPAAVISTLEAQETLVLNGKAKFTSTHDVYSNEYGATWQQGYTRAMMVQWINTGDPTQSYPYNHGFIKQVVCPIDQPYSRRPLYPPWIHPLGDVDLNFDGKVDIFDIVQVGLSFGSEAGQPEYNIEADVDVNGVIDIFDCVKIALKFGEEVTPWPPDP